MGQYMILLGSDAFFKQKSIAICHKVLPWHAWYQSKSVKILPYFHVCYILIARILPILEKFELSWRKSMNIYLSFCIYMLSLIKQLIIYFRWSSIMLQPLLAQCALPVLLYLYWRWWWVGEGRDMFSCFAGYAFGGGGT